MSEQVPWASVRTQSSRQFWMCNRNKTLHHQGLGLNALPGALAVADCDLDLTALDIRMAMIDLLREARAAGSGS